MATRPHFQRLVERVRLLPPLPAAFVYPCDRDSIQLALSGAFAGYLAPVLVGPEARIRDLAGRSGLDISRLPIVDTADTPKAATERAILLVRDGKVTALVKGSMSDGDLLAPVAAAESGLRTDRRLSHAYFVDLSGAAERHAARRRGAQHRAESRREEGHRRQHDRPRAHARRRRSGRRAARRAGPAIGRLPFHDRRRRAEDRWRTRERSVAPASKAR